MRLLNRMWPTCKRRWMSSFVRTGKVDSTISHATSWCWTWICPPYQKAASAEGSERGYMGRCRSKTGRKLVRVRAAASQEIVWETVIAGRKVESLPVVQAAISGMEKRLGLSGEDTDTLKKRGRTEIREDAWLG